MAAITSVNIALQSRDWESIIGIIFNTAEPELRDMLFNLQTQYKALATKPASTDVITVAGTEGLVMKIVPFLYGVSVNNITKDSGANPLSRIMTALRALNNVADNYINTSMTAFDNSAGNILQAVRKTGRQFIMNLQYDNN